ncbi:hypothetical protein GTE46_005541 [Salmonella enterica subsp. enterica]|nr:hypothetical protein [Salmonella enterica subsp. enterica]EDY2803979.1 hypothetical protein [Salmonella enterica subsp. enterica]
MVVFLDQDTVWNDIPEHIRLSALERRLCNAWCSTPGLSGTQVDIPVCGRTRDNIFLLNRNAPGTQEEINRLTWHLSDMVRNRHHVTAPEARVLESSVW